MINSEKEFTVVVHDFVCDVVNEWKIGKSKARNAYLQLNEIVVLKEKSIPSGEIPQWDKDDIWFWDRFSRELDVIVAREVKIKDEQCFLPLVAIELKTGNNLITSEIDTKDTIYTALKERYPCLMTCFILHSNQQRRVRNKTLLRNGRHFDRVISDWNKAGKLILRQALLCHLNYALWYWER